MLAFKNPRVLEILKTRMEFTDKLSLNNRLWFMVIVHKREDRMKRFAASLARVLRTNAMNPYRRQCRK